MTGLFVGEDVLGEELGLWLDVREGSADPLMVGEELTLEMSLSIAVLNHFGF